MHKSPSIPAPIRVQCLPKKMRVHKRARMLESRCLIILCDRACAKGVKECLPMQCARTPMRVWRLARVGAAPHGRHPLFAVGDVLGFSAVLKRRRPFETVRKFADFGKSRRADAIHRN